VSELTLTVLRLGFLVLLWLFVVSVVAVLRRDLFGTRVVQRPARRRETEPPRRPSPPPAEERRPAPRQQPRGPRQLVVTDGSLKGTSISLGDAAVTVGRAAGNTLVLNDDYASSRHARLYRDGDRWVLEDLGSTNGTFVGEERISAPTPVDAGVRLRVGRSVLELRR
jgi:pSer/pThr/pTyr-binding forkhead associated (FHA) protein